VSLLVAGCAQGLFIGYKGKPLRQVVHLTGITQCAILQESVSSSLSSSLSLFVTDMGVRQTWIDTSHCLSSPHSLSVLPCIPLSMY
jgi:hypothetical protein